MDRLDLLLVNKSLAPSRTKAKELIESGAVEIHTQSGWISAKSASQKVEPTTEIRVTDPTLLKYVSRAGLKLQSALEHLQLDVADLDVIDMGLSTGGFTDCLIQHGAKYVVGVDVGKDQVSPQLRQSSKLTVLEELNGRNLLKEERFRELKVQEFDLAVMDVSFISMTLLLDTIRQVLKQDGRLLSLVKPQFELQAGDLNKKGLVKDKSSFERVREKIITSCGQNGFDVKNYFESGFPGRDGNREFFVFAEVKK